MSPLRPSDLSSWSIRRRARLQVERLEAERERQRAAEVAKERERQKQLDEAAALRRRHNERLHVRQKLTLKAVFALTAVTGFALGWTYL